MKISERLYESCRAIIECVSKEENTEIREIKLKDLLHRYELLKNELEPNSNNGNVIMPSKEEKKKFDIGIFTVVSVEFEQLKSILPFDQEKSAALPDINGLDYFVAEIERENGATPLSVLVTLIGFAGNVTAAIACMRTFRRYDLGLSIICGIGAGVKEDNAIEKYSVVVSDGVFDYEYQRLEEDGITYRTDPIDIAEYHKRKFAQLSSIQAKWKEDYLRYAELNLIDPTDFNITALKNVKIKNGLIASGGKLLADGKTLKTLREDIQIKKGVLAAEMEGNGFAAVCKEFNKDWLIFRGISDLGEGDKNDPLNKKYQKIAAAAAVKAVIYYLKFLYTKPEERDIEF